MVWNSGKEQEYRRLKQKEREERLENFLNSLENFITLLAKNPSVEEKRRRKQKLKADFIGIIAIMMSED